MTVASTIVPFFGYKYLFSAPEFVRDLILGFVPDEWLHGLDFTGICNLRLETGILWCLAIEPFCANLVARRCIFCASRFAFVSPSATMTRESI